MQQTIKKDLQLNKDYIMVNEVVWTCLQRVYGGGPTIARHGHDIYSQALSQPTDVSIIKPSNFDIFGQERASVRPARKIAK